MADRIEGSMKALVEDITREAETRAKSVANKHKDPQLAVDYLDEMADLMQEQAVYLRSVRQEISVAERIRQQDRDDEAAAIDYLRL